MGRTKGTGKRKPRTVRTETYGKGSVYQDKKGVWWFQPPPKDGERIRRIRAATEQEARLAQKDHLAKRDQGVAVSDIPTVTYWFEFCLREHIAPGLQESTVEWYRYLIEHYILPAIGDGGALINQVTSDHLIMLQNSLRKRLGLRTVARVHELLDRVFKKATTSRKIPYNPMDAVERPRVPRSPQKAYEPEHEMAFRRAVAGHRYELAYDLMFLQGFRRGEVLGLLVAGYNPATGVLTVAGQVQTVKGKTGRKGKTKTDSGVRDVPLTPRQQEMMKKHLAELSEERARLGVDWKEHGLLFPSEKGTPVIPRNFNRHYYQMQEKAKIPHYTLHATRHTAATRFNTVKASKADQQAIMGHSPGDVGDGYIHPPMRVLYDILVAAEREMLERAA